LGDKCIREDLSNPEELMGNPDYSTLKDETRIAVLSIQSATSPRE
jgi:hypothetical protein